MVNAKLNADKTLVAISGGANSSSRTDHPDLTRSAARELIVAKRLLMAARADGGGTLARPHGDLNALVVGSESCSVVDESPETVAAV